MISLKQAAAGAALVLVSGTAVAGVSGNVGVVSDYMFRGISQSDKPAIQGGLDYEHDSGLYLGTWASSISFAGGAFLGTGPGGTEQDFYVGFAKEFGPVGIDVSVIYYWYPEEDEAAGTFSTLEGGLSVSVGPVSLSYHYSDQTNFFSGSGTADDAGYLQLALEQAIKDGLSLTASVGQYAGDEVDLILGGTYTAYSLGLAKELDAGFSATFQFIGTDLKTTALGFDDEPKFVVGLTKSFDL